MSNLPKEYKICKIKIKKPKTFKISKIKVKKLVVKKLVVKKLKVTNLKKPKGNISIQKKIVNTNIENKEEPINFKVSNSIKEQIINIDEKIGTTDNTIAKIVHHMSNISDNISLIIDSSEKDIEYKEHYITVTLCYNFRVTNKPISTLEYTHLIGTNILAFIGDEIPVFKIDNIKDIKYKKLVREHAKKLWNIKNKYILAIKHINNYKNFHNYLVLLDNNTTTVKKFINKFTNKMSSIKKDYCWKTYLGMYDPLSINPSKREVYQTIAKNTLSSFNLKLKEHKPNKLFIKDIYKSISFCIGDGIY
jgi:hypothetical protein